MIKELIEKTKLNGGCSVNVITGDEPKTGYMVARQGFELVVDINRPDLEQVIARFMMQVDLNPSLNKTSVYLDTWVSNGVMYLDYSDRLNSFEFAMQLGRARHQLAIYDLVKKVTVTL